LSAKWSEKRGEGLDGKATAREAKENIGVPCCRWIPYIKGKKWQPSCQEETPDKKKGNKR